VRCIRVPVKLPKLKEPQGFCTYHDWTHGDCCDGVEEGTPCIGESCEAYEPYWFGIPGLDCIA